ncbi:MAG TPA: SDR family NAD(P)-dependent oxidoreductase [Gemmatimonadales bacterium]|nr:SDR family NAD(P)-dependent oxidoreductase [Gemmatimonadales bacterium]
MRLGDARVLVTGGSSGIGRGIAELLIRRGARVAICGRDERRLRETAAAIGALPIRADVSDEADVERMVERVIAELGDYNVLVNNAGIGSWAPLVETTAGEMRRVWETNVLGAMLVARASARYFITRSRGDIINVASTAAHRGGAGGTSYTSSKFALRGMTECWRAELRAHNIRVMLVSPSEVITDFFVRSGREQPDNPTKLHPEEIAHVVAAMLEMEDRGFVTEATVWATNPR